MFNVYAYSFFLFLFFLHFFSFGLQSNLTVFSLLELWMVSSTGDSWVSYKFFCFVFGKENNSYRCAHDKKLDNSKFPDSLFFSEKIISIWFPEISNSQILQEVVLNNTWCLTSIDAFIVRMDFSTLHSISIQVNPSPRNKSVRILYLIIEMQWDSEWWGY